MAAVVGLQGASICERDTDGECMFVWVYPQISQDLKEVILNKCSILTEDHSETKFCFCQVKGTWYYILRTDISQAHAVKNVNDVFFVILAEDFNPELYQNLAECSTKDYLKGHSTTKVLQNFLSMYTKGYCLKDDDKKLVHTDFDKRKAYMETCIKEMITLFGMESILIYVAVLLKKRIAIYHPKLTTLHHICRSLPAFCIHRKDWNIVYPFLTLTGEKELEEIKNKRTYVAGFTNCEVENRPDLYDIYLQASDGEIVLNPQSKECFQMGKMHKEIAKFLLQASENEDMADEDIIKELTRRTRDIINNLRSLDGENPDDPHISLELLQSKNLTNVMQTFLFNLASAEGLVRL